MTSSRSESHVIAGLNDYRFIASLHVQHPTITPDEVTGALQREPKSTKLSGEQRRSPDGSLLTGTYDANHWSCGLSIINGHNVSEFLTDFVRQLSQDALKLIRRIDDTAGSVVIFFGIFAAGLCDFEIPASTLRRLGNAGVSVRLDYYSVDKADSTATTGSEETN